MAGYNPAFRRAQFTRAFGRFLPICFDHAGPAGTDDEWRRPQVLLLGYFAECLGEKDTPCATRLDAIMAV
jgi:hypothetical protein